MGQVIESRKQELVKLRSVWEKQTTIRRQKAIELMERLKPTPDGKPYVEIEVTHQGDKQHALSLLANYLTDRRRLNEAALESVLDVLETDEPSGNPASLIELFITEVRVGASSPKLQKALPGKENTILDFFSEENLTPETEGWASGRYLQPQ